MDLGVKTFPQRRWIFHKLLQENTLGFVEKYGTAFDVISQLVIITLSVKQNLKDFDKWQL